MPPEVGQFIPFLLMLAVFYFVLIRPQVQERNAHEQMLDKLVKGDRVATTGGMHGKVVSVAEHTVVVEIAKNTHVTLDKPSVVRKLGAQSGSIT